jgi:hypothetical protein
MGLTGLKIWEWLKGWREFRGKVGERVLGWAGFGVFLGRRGGSTREGGSRLRVTGEGCHPGIGRDLLYGPLSEWGVTRREAVGQLPRSGLRGPCLAARRPSSCSGRLNRDQLTWDD